VVSARVPLTAAVHRLALAVPRVDGPRSVTAIKGVASSLSRAVPLTVPLSRVALTLSLSLSLPFPFPLPVAVTVAVAVAVAVPITVTVAVPIAIAFPVTLAVAHSWNGGALPVIHHVALAPPGAGVSAHPILISGWEGPHAITQQG
jgi:hypothetical protein